MSRPAEPDPDGALHVAVCALTFRRPEGLAAMLEGLTELEPPGPEHDVTVVVVDNDGDASGEPVVRAAEKWLRWPVVYEVEARRGIAQGRNRAVRLARAAGADVVVFLDDDEVPEPRWLVELLRVRRRTGAAIVTGPVLPCFVEPPPDWAVDGRFFERPRFATGTSMHYARTSNVLIDAAAIPDGDQPFAEWFGLSGGDDTHFFARARLAGHRMVWADEAVVTEAVPPSRVRVDWLAKREYRRGNTLSLVMRDLMDSRWRRARRAVHGVLRVVQGVLVVVSGAWRGRVAVVRGLQLVGFGAGLLSGLAGVRYDEYRVVHGN